MNFAFYRSDLYFKDNWLHFCRWPKLIPILQPNCALDCVRCTPPLYSPTPVQLSGAAPGWKSETGDFRACKNLWNRTLALNLKKIKIKLKGCHPNSHQHTFFLFSQILGILILINSFSDTALLPDSCYRHLHHLVYCQRYPLSTHYQSTSGQGAQWGISSHKLTALLKLGTTSQHCVV